VTPGGSARARILTINVQNTEGDQRRQEILRAGIERIDPDLVSFQEVVESSDCHQLDELIGRTELHGTHQAGSLSYEPAWMDRYGGTAIASRWPYVFVGSALSYPDGYCRIRTARLAFDQPAAGTWASDHLASWSTWRSGGDER
jgi:endonuclease/exonuclease/phosphatase family metal-dependent hydrolase